MKLSFKCNECESKLKVGVNNDSAQNVVCLECGEQHRVIVSVQNTVSSHNTYRKESWLANEYAGRGRSMASIAKECAVSPMTIYKWLNTHGIATRPTGRRKE
jgi:transposase-like protein